MIRPVGTFAFLKRMSSSMKRPSRPPPCICTKRKYAEISFASIEERCCKTSLIFWKSTADPGCCTTIDWQGTKIRLPTCRGLSATPPPTNLSATHAMLHMYNNRFGVLSYTLKLSATLAGLRKIFAPRCHINAQSYSVPKQTAVYLHHSRTTLCLVHLNVVNFSMWSTPYTWASSTLGWGRLFFSCFLLFSSMLHRPISTKILDFTVSSFPN